MEATPQVTISKASMVSSPMSSVYLHHLLPVKRYVSHFSRNKDRKAKDSVVDDQQLLNVIGSSRVAMTDGPDESHVEIIPSALVTSNDDKDDEHALTDDTISDCIDTRSIESETGDISIMTMTLDTTAHSEESDGPTQDELYMKTLEDRINHLNMDLEGIFRERDQLKRDIRVAERNLEVIRSNLDTEENERESARKASYNEMESKIGVIMSHYVQLNEIYLLQESEMGKNREYFDRLTNDIHVLNDEIEKIKLSIEHCSNLSKENTHDMENYSLTDTCVENDDDNDDNIYLIALSHQLDQLQNELNEEMVLSDQCKSRVEELNLYSQNLNKSNRDLADALTLSRLILEDENDGNVPYTAWEGSSNLEVSKDTEHDSSDHIGVYECNLPNKHKEYVNMRKTRKKHVQKPTFTSIHRQVLQTKLKEKCSNEHAKEKSIHGCASFIPSGKEYATKNLIASNSQFHRQKMMFETATPSPSSSMNLQRYYDDDVIRLVYRYYNEIIE